MCPVDENGPANDVRKYILRIEVGGFRRLKNYHESKIIFTYLLYQKIDNRRIISM